MTEKANQAPVRKPAHKTRAKAAAAEWTFPDPKTDPYGFAAALRAGHPGALAELKRRNQSARELLRSWIDCAEEGAQEQRESFEHFKKAVNETRRAAGMRLAFPEDEATAS